MWKHEQKIMFYDVSTMGPEQKGLCTTNEELRTDVASQKMADINGSFDAASGAFGGGSASMGGGSAFLLL